MQAEPSGIVIYILGQVDHISQDFVIGGYHSLVQAYSPLVYALVILSIIVFGYAILHGWIEMSLGEIAKRALLIGFILSLALHWDIFSNYVYKVFTKAPNEISAVLIKSVSDSKYTGAASVNGALQQALDDGLTIVKATLDKGSLYNPLPWLWAVLLLLVILVLVILALLELIVAKFGLAIFLVLAPLMIPMLLFRATKEALFDGWFRHLVTYAFIPIFVTLSLALGLSLMITVTNQVKGSALADTITFKDLIPYAIYALACIGLVLKSAFMAANMAGGFSSGASGAIHSAARKGYEKLTKPGSPGDGGKKATNINMNGDAAQLHVHNYSNEPLP